MPLFLVHFAVQIKLGLKISDQKETRPVLDRFHDSSKVNALCSMLCALCSMLYVLCFMLHTGTILRMPMPARKSLPWPARAWPPVHPPAPPAHAREHPQKPVPACPRMPTKARPPKPAPATRMPAKAEKVCLKLRKCAKRWESVLKAEKVC